MLVRKITEINSPISRRGAGGEAYEQDYGYSSGIDLQTERNYLKLILCKRVGDSFLFINP